MIVTFGARSVRSRLCPYDLDGEEVVEEDQCIPDKSGGQRDDREGTTDEIDASHNNVEVDNKSFQCAAYRDEDGNVKGLSYCGDGGDEGEGQNHA